VLFAARDLRCGFPGEFELVRCVACGTVRTVPRPERPLDYYPSDYYSYAQTAETMLVRLRRAVVLRRYGVRPPSGAVERVLACLLRGRVAGLPHQRGRLLDVGCGSGETLELLARAGFAVAGVEPSRRAANAAQARGLHVHCGTLEDAPFSDGDFELVRFWHVLEHTPDPAAALECARRLLVPGGTLILGVPNFASLPARLARSRWYGLEVPRHLYHFEPATMRRLLERTAFERVRISYASGGGFAGTLDTLLARRRRFEPPLVERAWLVAALAPVEWALDALRIGEGLEVVAAAAA
jgi:SAM-dependent methyltransferase